MNNQNIDIDLELGYLEQDSQDPFKPTFHIEFEYRQGNQSAALIPPSTGIDPDLYIYLRFTIKEGADRTKLEKEFKEICNSYKVILTSFIRPIREIVKLMTLTFSVHGDHAYVMAKITKPDQRDELLQFIEEIYRSFEKSDPGHIKLNFMSTLNFDDLIQEGKIQQMKDQSAIVTMRGSLSKQTPQFYGSVMAFLQREPNKKFRKYRQWLSLLRSGKLNLQFKNAYRVPKYNLSAFPKKSKIKIPIFQKSMNFADANLDSSVVVEFGCRQLNIGLRINYQGHFSQILKCLIIA